MYDFTTCPDRRHAASEKYNDMLKKCPNVPEGIIPLSVADMEFKNAPEITEGLAEYLKDTVLGYTSPTEGFVEAVLGWLKNRHSYDVKREWLAVSDGVVPAIGDLIRATTSEGDGIIILSPVYYPFKGSIERNDRKAIEVDLLYDGHEYTIDFEKLEKAAADESNKLLIFCNPHNPVGRVWTKEELRRVYDICVKNDVFIIDDEIHNDLIMPGFEHTVMANIAEDAGKHMAVCVAPSKSFNLAGMQTSVVVIEDHEKRRAFWKSRSQSFRYDVNILGMEACRLAYTKCEKWLDECIETIHENAEYLKSFMNEHFPEIVVYPLEGTYLIWCDFNAWGMNEKELEDFMVNEAFLFLDEGYIFGDSGKGFERFNLACPKSVLKDALERLLEARRKMIN